MPPRESPPLSNPNSSVPIDTSPWPEARPGELGVTPVPREKPPMYDPNGWVPITSKPEPEAPGIGQFLWALVRNRNWVGSMILYPSPRSEPNPADDFYSEIKGTQYERFAPRFGFETWNSEDREKLKRRIDLELEDARTIAAAGIWGEIGSLFVGALVPDNYFFPGGSVIRAAKAAGESTIRSITSAALRTFVSHVRTGVGPAIFDEAMLHATQATRSKDPLDFAFNITTGTLFNAILGSGKSALLSVKDHARLGKQFDAEMPQLARSGDMTPEIRTKVVDVMAERLSAAGFSDADARNQAVLYGARYQALSNSLGLSVDELLKTKPLFSVDELRKSALRPKVPADGEPAGAPTQPDANSPVKDVIEIIVRGGNVTDEGG